MILLRAFIASHYDTGKFLSRGYQALVTDGKPSYKSISAIVFKFHQALHPFYASFVSIFIKDDAISSHEIYCAPVISIANILIVTIAPVRNALNVIIFQH